MSQPELPKATPSCGDDDEVRFRKIVLPALLINLINSSASLKGLSSSVSPSASLLQHWPVFTIEHNAARNITLPARATTISDHFVPSYKCYCIRLTSIDFVNQFPFTRLPARSRVGKYRRAVTKRVNTPITNIFRRAVFYGRPYVS